MEVQERGMVDERWRCRSEGWWMRGGGAGVRGGG